MTPVVDLHIHLAANDRPDCRVSPKMQDLLAFCYMLLATRISRDELDDDFDRTILTHLIDALDSAPSVDGGVFLAMDGRYVDGELDPTTDFLTSNEYAREVTRGHRKVLFGASVTPTRRDAREALEDSLSGDPPPALVKVIPNTQGFHPATDVDDWYYEALAEAGVPLLCHAGPEHAVPLPEGEEDYQLLGDPRHLTRALDIGVTVIMAHAATRFFPFEKHDYLDELADMMRRADENGRWKLYADVSAMCVLCRIGTVDKVLKRLPHDRLVLGSDYPIPVNDMPPVLVPGVSPIEYLKIITIRNPLEKNYQQLLAIGFPDTIGTRAAEILGPRSLATLL